MAQTTKVLFTKNVHEQRSGIRAYRGEERTVLSSVAGRLIGAGVAVEAEHSEAGLESRTKAELLEVAGSTGVEVDSKQTKAEIIEAIQGEGA